MLSNYPSLKMSAHVKVKMSCLSSGRYDDGRGILLYPRDNIIVNSID